MNARRACIYALSALLGAATGRAQSKAPAAKGPMGFETFALVRMRNIFDPDRSPGRRETTRTTSAPAPATGRTPNYVTLTGTMVTATKTLAFFNGSRGEYNKVISVGDAIADFKIKSITETQVDLEHAGHAVTVAVGRQVPIENATAPEAAPATAEKTATAGESATPPAAAPSTNLPAADKADIIRRMMERRQKENTP